MAVFALQIWVCYTLCLAIVRMSKNCRHSGVNIHWLIAFGPPVEGDKPPFDGGYGYMAPSSAGNGSGIFSRLIISSLSQPGVGIPTLFVLPCGGS